MKICVIGLGSMGRRRIRLLKAISKDVIIMGVDNDSERVKSVAGEFGINCYSKLYEEVDESDCAFVCTSPQYHARIIRECLEKGLHVFSEINLIEDLYDENIKLAEQKGKVLFLSSTPLYKEEMQIIDNRIRQNGKKCVYQYHVGQYLPDWHPWDNLRDFFVSNKKTNGCREFLAIELPWIQHTFGRIQNVNVMKTELTDLGLGFPDTYVIQIEHENGNIGSLTVDIVSRQAVRRLEIFNETLYLRWEGTPDSLYEKNLTTGKLEKMQAGAYSRENGYNELINEQAYLDEIKEFFEVIKGKKPMYGFEEDRETLRLIDEIEGCGGKDYEEK